jgi:site-specific recombinase XerD
MTPTPLLDEYQVTLSDKAPGTVSGYRRALVALTKWITQLPGNQKTFQPEDFTHTAFQTYMKDLEDEGYSPSYRNLVKSAASGFARWLIEEKGLLQRDPTRGVAIQAQPLLAPRVLTDDQRYVLKNLVERADDVRGEALFALGYWAGCRVSDVSHLKLDDVLLHERSGWLWVGYKGNKLRQIDINAPVRQALQEYLAAGARKADSPYVFTSQRADRLTEAGIHHWFRTLKSLARRDEVPYVADISFHDLRHDFAHRAREAGWSLEELAFYLGHITKRGTPAVQTTVRYTQASREQIKAKLKLISG